MGHVAALKTSPIALATAAANQQHYEVPAAFFEKVLGRHLKYSCCDWSESVSNLDEAEERMLALSAERAGVDQLVLISHDPERTDDGVDDLLAAVQERFPNTIAAYAGMQLDL